jgi:tetratricopeptide (TPR) repeat protein
MELLLTRPDATASRVDVTCDGQASHSFDLLALFPTKTNGLPHPMNDPVKYGAALYTTLFPPDSLAHKTLAWERERILLVAADETLDAVPWEYLHGPDGFVVCDVPFIRGLLPEQRIAPPDMLSGLHIVAVASSPLDHHLAPLNIQGEWTRLTEIVGDLDRAVTLERTWPPTIERLRDLVAGEVQRVVHFMGHGGQNKQGEAVLCFEQDNGAREDISAGEFVQRVQGSVFLVTLNACESATLGETGFGNLARALVREQVPYALGMRFSIVDDDALAFSRTFYRNLARGVSVEESLRQARLTLAKSEQAWAAGNLILYTSLTGAAPGSVTAPGKPDVRDAQEDALRRIIGVLPEVQGAFQGRIDEQIQLGNWLTGDRRPRIMTIHGSGGQGKTALARVAAERFAHAWPGGVWAISLETVPTRAVFAASLARFLAINPQEFLDPADLERQVLLRLHRQRTLLVLDNLETMDEAAKAQDADALALAEFIQQLPGERTSLLCTSRHLLGWSGEQRLELSGLAPDEGAALFQQSASLRSDAIDHDLRRAQELSRSLDGHPLGLFLLGKAFNETSLSLKDFLADYETFLLSAQEKFAAVPLRQRTLYANFDYSVKWLPPDLRNLFSKLWLFHAPFLPQTAIAILDPDAEARGEARSPVADQLHALWQRGLLTREGAEEQGVLLYHVPPVMRPYIERYLADEGERTPLLARYGSAYAGLLRYLFTELDRGALASTLVVRCYDDLERGRTQVRGIEQGYYLLRWGWILQRLGDRVQGVTLTEQALEIGQALDQALMLQAMNNMAMVYQTTGRPQDALRLYEQALPIMEVGDRSGEGTTLNNLGGVYDDLGQKPKALDYYEQALVILREVGDRSGEGTTLNNLGLLYDALGQKPKALDYYQQALAIHREVGNRQMEGTTLNNLGRVYNALGQKPQALDYYEQALVILREVGDRSGEGTTLNNLGGVYDDLGQKPQALDYYEQALVILREVGDRSGEGTTLNNLGLLYDALGQKPQALDYYQQALAIHREVGNRQMEGTTLNNLGRVYNALGQKPQALDYYEQALVILREVGDRSGEGTTLNNLGRVYDDLGQKPQALDYYEQALLILREVGDRSGEGTTLNNLGRVYNALGQKAQALDYYEQALVILREVGDRSGEGTTLNNLGGVYNALGQKPQALDYYQQALLIRREVGDRSGEGTTLNNLGLLYNALGQKPQALDYYEQALVILREVGDRSGEVVTLVNIAVLLYQEQHQQEAIATLEQALAILDATGLPQDAAGQTPEMIGQVLQAMHDGTFPSGQSGGSSTMSAEQITVFVGNTVAVMTTVPERRAEWREAVQQARENAESRGTDWQIEVEFFTAILAILDGQAPSLPADHPYAAAIAAIQNGIANGEPAADEDDEGDAPEGVQALAAFVQACVAALQSNDPQVKMAFMQQLVTLQADAPDEEMKALFQAIQLAFFGGDLAHLSDKLTGFARQIWEWIVAGVQQNDSSVHAQSC